MATIHKLFDRPPPRRTVVPLRHPSLEAPLVNGARPEDYRLDLAAREAAALTKAGFRLTLLERLDLDGASFIVGLVCGVVATLALLVMPFVIGWVGR